MSKTIIIIIFALSICTFSSFGQNKYRLPVDTIRILLDENLDSFVAALKSEHFQTFKDKKNIPSFIKEQLDCLTKDKFSLANPKEEYRCCCTSSQESPVRQLLFFSLSENTLPVAGAFRLLSS